jgi:hypothetical protein
MAELATEAVRLRASTHDRFIGSKKRGVLSTILVDCYRATGKKDASDVLDFLMDFYESHSPHIEGDGSLGEEEE